MRENIFYLITLTLLILALTSCWNQQKNAEPEKDYPITPIPFTDVHLNDQFWLPRILTNTEVTIPIAFEQSEETGRIKNFEIAGGMKEGSFCSLYGFDDSDVFKIIEGASYSLMIKVDPKLEAYLDSLIYKISMAQEDDGYLYTNRTIMGDSALPMAGKKRWERIEEGSHELYNAGHLYEAAVAYYQATGKRTLLDVAIKNANLIYKTFGWGKLEIYPGHQEIEIGLIKLYRVTGNKKYLDLAKFFLDVRGPEGWDYNQAMEKPVDQQEPVGHAVRALYMYSAMADVAAMTGDSAYLKAIDKIWNNLITKKLYITGGIGQSGGNEGFGPDYDLPNMTAYCETCASIANVFWNQRMFLLSGDARYIDVMERTMYNALLSGISLTGNRFFYPNPLESNGDDERQAWYGCACCPSNISRFLPSVPGYVYAQKDNEIFINLFITSETNFKTANGELNLQQQSDYPWNGEISIMVNLQKAMQQTINVRIPGWTRNRPLPGDLYRFYQTLDEKPEIRINGELVKFEVSKGYASIDRIWQSGDKIELILPMPVRKVLASDKVKADNGRYALQRGPLVFCAEDKDNKPGKIRFILADIRDQFIPHFNNELMGGVMQIGFEASDLHTDLNGKTYIAGEKRHIETIPYAYWANRGAGQMLVWIPYQAKHATPAPAPTIAYLSKKTGPDARGNLQLLSDQYNPANSNDHSVGYVHWWPMKDTTVWLEYEFEKPATISQTNIYWFDDGPDGGCRIPKSWKLFYKSGNEWKPVSAVSDYIVTKDAWDTMKFNPVKTNAVKLEVGLQKEFSSGVHEWEIK